MKRFIVLIGLIGLLGLTSMAQKYVIDYNFGDSVDVFKIKMLEDGKTETLDESVMKLAMGEEVEVTRLLKGQTGYGAIEIDGKEYGVHQRYLLFSEDNAEGVEDVFEDTREQIQHSWAGKFFATFTPYALISLLFVAAILFVFLGFKIAAVRGIALYAVPVCILLASLLEVWAYAVLGTDSFWWCSMDRYGFWGSLIRAIPFVAFVAFQLYSIKAYEKLLLGNDSDKKLSIKPMAISLAICIPLALVVVFALASMGVKGISLDILTIVSFLASLAVGVLISLRKNIKVLGKAAGMAFTVFGIVYIVGSIVAIIGLVIVIFEIILQILIICAALFGVGFAMSQGGGGGKGNGGAFKRADGKYVGRNGGVYDSWAEANSN